MKDLFGHPIAPPKPAPKQKIVLPPPLTTIPRDITFNYRPYRVVKLNKCETIIWNT